MNSQTGLPSNMAVAYAHCPFLVFSLGHIAIGSVRVATGARASIHLLSPLLVKGAIIPSECRIGKFVRGQWVINLGQSKVVTIRHVDSDCSNSGDIRNPAI